jgi:hypothetical protein
MEKKIKIVNNWNIKDIFDELEKGNLKIPKFQRGYVWERSKIVKLLNSIHSQYPIGSFFIWDAGLEYGHFCKEITELDFPEEPQANKYSFILDGQQRITSLYVALKGKKFNGINFASICFNLEKNVFQIPRLKNEKHNIPCWKLFDTREYGNVYAEYITDRQKAETWQICQDIFANYPISVIFSLGMDLEQVVKIFERINQGGKKLTLFDLVHASTWSREFDLREKIKTFNNEDNIKSFGGLVNEIFTQSLALNAFDDCSNRNQLNLTSDKCSELWNQTTECLRLTIDFLKEFGVRFIDFIPYSSFLPIIQYYFFKSGRNNVGFDHKSYIENWFWTSTFSQRFSSSSLTKMKDDAGWIYNLTKNKLEDNTFVVSLTIKELRKIRMQNQSVIKNGVLCLMALENPVDFDNGQIVILDRSNVSKSNSKENHHFFPYSLRNKFGVDNNEINSLLNFAFISSRLNKAISNNSPSKYMDKYQTINSKFKENLFTHFIDEAAMAAAIQNDYNKFIENRGDKILKKIFEKVNYKDFTDPEDDIIEENIEYEDEFVNEEELV